MPSAKPLLLSGAVLLAVVGSLFGSAWATGVGCVVALCLLAVHPTVTDPAVSRSTRWLLRGGLLLVSLAAIVKTTGWVAGPRWGDPTVSASELIALVVDPAWQNQLFWRELAVASCLILACVCFGVAIGRLPRQRLRRFAAAVPTVGVLTLVTVVFVVLLPAGLTGLLGSWTNVAATVMLVLGGYAWVVGGAVRRHGSVTIAAVGATVLAAAAGHAAYDAWQSRPEPPVDDLFLRPGAAVAVAVETGPDIQTAVKVALLLIAATLTVTACARLSADSQTR